MDANAAAGAAPGLLRRALSVPAAPLVAFRLAYAACHPPRRPGRDPGPFRLDLEDISIPVPAERGQLSGWLCRGDRHRVVVLGHGIGLDKSRSLGYARFLFRAGYTVLLFDFRNHGGSFQDRGLAHYHQRFVRDVHAAVRHMRALYDGQGTRVVLYGFSLSSFAMLHAVAGLDDPVDAVICDSGPSDRPSATVLNLLRSGMLPVPRSTRTAVAYRVLTAAYQRFSSVMMGWPSRWPPSGAQPGYATTPALFVTGQADRLVPVEEVRRVAAGLPRAELYVVPEAGHMQTMANDPNRYTRAVLDFLARTVGQPRVGV